MNASDILAELKPLGSASYKKLLMTNHGVKEPFFGVKIGDLKKIQKRIKKDHQLALDLYDTGNYDAMYLAGLIADDTKMAKADLQHWVENAAGGALPGSTVPWVAAGSPEGWEVALKWIDSPKPLIAAAGWTTLGHLASLTPDAELELPISKSKESRLATLRSLILRVEKTIHDSPNDTRYAINGFLIAVGSYVKPLSDLAIKTAEKIGPVTVDMGNNSCHVPLAAEYIHKAQSKGSLTKKRKSVKC